MYEFVVNLINAVDGVNKITAQTNDDDAFNINQGMLVIQQSGTETCFIPLANIAYGKLTKVEDKPVVKE